MKVEPSPSLLSIDQLAAMAVDDVLDDRQPQPRAAHRARPPAIHPVETLGQPRQMLGGDAVPIIADRERHAPARAGQRPPGATTAVLTRTVPPSRPYLTAFSSRLCSTCAS